MSARSVNNPVEAPVEVRRSYDPNNLHPLDEEARKYDDTSEGIDWDEIIASTQNEWLAGDYDVFNPEDYPTDEALIEALKRSRDEALGRGDA